VDTIPPSAPPPYAPPPGISLGGTAQPQLGSRDDGGMPVGVLILCIAGGIALLAIALVVYAVWCRQAGRGGSLKMHAVVPPAAQALGGMEKEAASPSPRALSASSPNESYLHTPLATDTEVEAGAKVEATLVVSTPAPSTATFSITRKFSSGAEADIRAAAIIAAADSDAEAKAAGQFEPQANDEGEPIGEPPSGDVGKPPATSDWDLGIASSISALGRQMSDSVASVGDALSPRPLFGRISSSIWGQEEEEQPQPNASSWSL